jgi:trans-AT polyketide synthase, acyltransferase and oxidoreductase domains
MGAGLFEKHPSLEAAADGILGYSIRELCWSNPEGRLSKTEYTQPALFTVNAMAFLDAQRRDSRPPAYVLGHSLGEYNALFAAGCFDFETGLRMVMLRGKLMSQVRNGGMAAVLDCPVETVERVLAECCPRLDIANINSPTQVVVSGRKEDILDAERHFAREKAKYIPLNVSGAFHSRFMEEPTAEFQAYLGGLVFSAPRIPVIANITALPYVQSEIAANLVRQMKGSVKWSQSIRFLLGQGAIDFEELGPGKVLTKLVAQITAAYPPVLAAVPALPAEAARPPAAAPAEPALSRSSRVRPERLGSEDFRRAHRVRYAYVSGAMVKGIASGELVVRMARSGLLGYFGTGGLSLAEVEKSIRYIRASLDKGESYGMNLLCNLDIPAEEMAMVDLFLAHGVTRIEASGFMRITPALLKYRLKGLRRVNGKTVCDNLVMAKVSRPEVAEAFLRPAPARLVERLLLEGAITSEEAMLGRDVPMADDLCVEADSGGHTDRGVASAIFPALRRLRDDIRNENAASHPVRVGCAGGLGTPDAIVSAFMLGADFVLTGSINQCTVEAGTSGLVKSMLQDLNVQNTDYAPAGDMFEIGAKIQVMKKGVFFPMRAVKLYELWKNNDSWTRLDGKTRSEIEESYFQGSFEEVCARTYDYYRVRRPAEVERAEKNPRHKMALAFKWYFVHSMRLALRGVQEQTVNFQVHCGPAMGACNQWLKRSELESWQSRHADVLAEKLMGEASDILGRRLAYFS